MTSISNNNLLTRIRRLLLCGFFLATMVVPHIGLAQTSADTGVSITLAPTLVELGMAPGEIWRSNLKVVNTNSFPLPLYIEPAHFAATGEQGQGTVIPIRDVPEDESLLVHWIRAEEPSIVVPPGTSRDIPFTVAVPEDASPGSHFAALQVSTVPPDVSNAAGLNTAQVISSLLFVRVAGDLNEAASIRSFTAEHSFGTDPSTHLSLRVQNEGNVHVQPEGYIVIRNVWGSERGRIPVNYNTSFGNVLPGTIREYAFAWEKAPSLFDIGYYSASVSLAYGVNARQFLSAQTGFWVIPIKPIVIALLLVGSIVVLIALVSRWYIGRLLRQAGVTSLQDIQPGQMSTNQLRPNGKEQPTDLVLDPTKVQRLQTESTHRRSTSFTAVRQLVRAWCTQLAAAAWLRWQQQTVRERRRVLFAIGATLLLLGVVFLWRHGTRDASYTATVGSGQAAVTYNAEEIAFFQQPGMSPSTLVSPNDAPYHIHIVNNSETTGAAGRLAADLQADFPIASLRSDPSAALRQRTVIVFPTNLQEEALAISERVPGALLSAVESATTAITVYVGNQ